MEAGDEVEGMKMEKKVFMWGYLPGALPQRLPILSPMEVKFPQSADAGEFWTDVCGGGCGFAMAISDAGKLITWGSTNDLGQSYVTSGKHGETPEPFPFPHEVSFVRAAAGWAHCVCVTADGEVYTWGWKECVPTGTIIGDQNTAETQEFERQNLFIREQMSPHSEGSRSSSDADSKTAGQENTKRKRVSSAKQAAGSSSSGDDQPLSALPCLVALHPGVRIAIVAAGGRHTLVLSDMGQVWGWGYGGEGQLGLGSRIRMVYTPRHIPCIATSSTRGPRVPGSYIKGIACGGRHSAVVTDAGALVTFGWGLYGQCGQGSSEDELRPTCVSSLLGIHIDSVAAGLWHTICISSDGDVFAFGGNQFGQLGTGTDEAETFPRLLDAPSLENEHARMVSCGARHSAIVTDEGKVFCWGWNKYGQLGLGDAIDRNIPCQVELDGHVPRVIACGWWHTLVLAEPLT